VRAVAALLLAAALGPASATTVWRCGPEGRLYADTPCADARAVDVSDARSAQQVDEARRIAAAERRLAERATADRLRREAADTARNAAPVSLNARSAAATDPRRPPSTRPPATKGKPARRVADAADGTFRAAAPGSRRRPD